MNCKDYQNLIIRFLSEDRLDESLQDVLQEHLLSCDRCAKYAEEVMLLLDFYARKQTLEDSFEDSFEIKEPNHHRIWRGVKNAIGKESISTKSLKKQRFSFGRNVLAILAVALLSSTLTALLVANFVKPKESFEAFSEPTFLEKALSYVGLLETPQQERLRRIKEQKALIEYWNQRIQMRQHQWNQKLREAFERNLSEIDQAVLECEKMLEKNPYDEVSAEMLDSAMREKLELLQEFAQL
ncbi:MAG: zf-HC2 domain-containing protein [Acidobacteria bacterium]|jgi:hypothetical protein|nr:MAG: zf-HC2 domain-containing protein [Acidobacteriota bacterium]GIU81871.1 MAG: hypothetical protein KatS3mg006_0935 [Pyrinomonadaceae bacterium]